MLIKREKWRRPQTGTRSSKVQLWGAYVVTNSLKSQSEHIHVSVQFARSVQAIVQSKGWKPADAIPEKERKIAVTSNA